MRIRTAIFGVYVIASGVAFAGVMGLVLKDVRLRYVESMRRTLGDTAAYLAAFAAPVGANDNWPQRLETLPTHVDVLRVFACDPRGRVVFDSAGRDKGQIYIWNMTGGGRAASEDYSVVNVAEVGHELRVVAPVRYRGTLVGWVGVGRPLTTVSAGVNAARQRLMVYAGAISLVMIVAGWWLAARLTEPLERLTVYARNVRDGRPAAPPRSGAREIAELSQAFEEMRDTLEGRQHVERYTQTLAHEVKAPLAAIRGAAELLDETMPPEQRQKFLANIRSEAARIQRIIERLLELSSLEARKELRERKTLAASQLAAAAADVMRPAFATRDLRLTLPSGDAFAMVEGEEVLLREAIVNLLQNAFEFSPTGGEVVLSWTRESDWVKFSVEDAGPGMPDYALPRVFERFYSLPRPGTERKSTGLGLALVHEIALLHHGGAALANRPSGGALATFWLPIKVTR